MGCDLVGLVATTVGQGHVGLVDGEQGLAAAGAELAAAKTVSQAFGLVVFPRVSHLVLLDRALRLLGGYFGALKKKIQTAVSLPLGAAQFKGFTPAVKRSLP